MKHDLTRAQRLLAEYRLRTADVQEWVAEMRDGEKVLCDQCGQMVGIESIGWHRDKHRSCPEVEDTQWDRDNGTDGDGEYPEVNHRQTAYHRGE
jgi:hypothetical protein